MDLLDFLALLILGPRFWLGIALGLVGAWLAWTYLPPTMDRASVAAWILVMGFIVGGVMAIVGERKKMNRSNPRVENDARARLWTPLRIHRDGLTVYLTVSVQ